MQENTLDRIKVFRENANIQEKDDDVAYNVNDGTLDKFIQDTAPEFDIDLDDESQDWGGIFGLMFSVRDDYTEEEARKIIDTAKRLYVFEYPQTP